MLYLTKFILASTILYVPIFDESVLLVVVRVIDRSGPAFLQEQRQLGIIGANLHLKVHLLSQVQVDWVGAVRGFIRVSWVDVHQVGEVSKLTCNHGYMLAHTAGGVGRWVDGWVDRCMGGWENGWICGCVSR